MTLGPDRLRHSLANGEKAWRHRIDPEWHVRDAIPAKLVSAVLRTGGGAWGSPRRDEDGDAQLPEKRPRAGVTNT
jgi:hypothetical protein